MKNKLIKKVTSDHDLIKIANILNIHIDNIYDLNEITKPLPSKGIYLILLRRSNSVGHWCVLNNNEYFDPAGVPGPTVLGDLKYSNFQYQGVDRQYCGIWCMFWLYTKQKNKPELLNGFIDLDIDVI